MSATYGPKHFEGMGYTFEQDSDGWYWVWIEPGEDDDTTRERFVTRGEAMLAAADDWSENGSSGLSGKDTLTATLRRLARIEAAKEATE